MKTGVEMRSTIVFSEAEPFAHARRNLCFVTKLVQASQIGRSTLTSVGQHHALGNFPICHILGPTRSLMSIFADAMIPTTLCLQFTRW